MFNTQSYFLEYVTGKISLFDVVDGKPDSDEEGGDGDGWESSAIPELGPNDEAVSAMCDRIGEITKKNDSLAKAGDLLHIGDFRLYGHYILFGQD